MIYWANNLLLFDRARRTAPGYLPAFVSLGDALATRGRIPPLERVFEQVLKADPRDWSALFSLGLSSFLDGNNVDCERSLSRAVKVEEHGERHLRRVGRVPVLNGEVSGSGTGHPDVP